MADSGANQQGDQRKTTLSKQTNWWGAFVIGLAGTILVTGIAPVMVTSLGAASIPITIAVTISGYLLCLLLAELSAMMPDRTGGSPVYAYVAFKGRWPRLAKHVNGVTAWMYWLGWFPVAPLNLIIAAGLIVNKLGLSDAGFTPIDTKISYWAVAISIIGLIGILIVALRGIRLGAVFATVLGVLSMVPLTVLAIAPFLHSSTVNWGELSGFHRLDGTGFFDTFAYAEGKVTGWPTLYLAYAFLLSWNVIAMEAAACYIGECRNPARDAKIAMNLEGLYGLFIYAMIPLGLVVALGAKGLADPALQTDGSADMAKVFSAYVSKVFSTGSAAVDWIVTITLVIALVLSALNAIMGTARSLFQMSIDGQFPRIFAHLNSHGMPDFSIWFNVACSAVVVLFGGAVAIYVFSNVGYIGSFVPVLIGYYFLRQDQPKAERPVRLPEFMKYVALAIAALYFIIWTYGGYQCCAMEIGGSKTFYYFIGVAVALAYLPLYFYRVYVQDRRSAREGVAPLSVDILPHAAASQAEQSDPASAEPG
jgi:amino acid transporter